MAERRPLVIIGGQISELPAGDTTPGSGAGGSGTSIYAEPVCVMNAGTPEIVFIDSGDVVSAPGEA
jgi:hypothetical protein